MNNSKRLSWIACVAIILMLSESTASQAGPITGSFQGVADMQVKQFLNNQVVGYIDVFDVPATLDFTLSINPGEFWSPAARNFDQRIHSIN